MLSLPEVSGVDNCTIQMQFLNDENLANRLNHWWFMLPTLRGGGREVGYGYILEEHNSDDIPGKQADFNT